LKREIPPEGLDLMDGSHRNIALVCSARSML
jgi:hypothetical protein